MRNRYLDEAIAALRHTGSQARSAFGALRPEQLNWKPGPGTWSIGQCLDHLITTHERYYPQFDAVACGQKRRSFWERIPLLPGLWGRMLLRSMRSPAKHKTVPAFTPADGTVRADIVEAFAANLEELIRRIEDTDCVDHARTMITSPAAAFVTYSLYDGIGILTAHAERHLGQAQRVQQMPEFPA
ncbi:MAG: DinB family protein [Bacteroidia bacterium]|nr:DinB family protein [Bacteroidia bacterium]